jgi:uncharacterized protein
MKALLARTQRRLEEYEALRRRVHDGLPALVDVLVREFGAREVVVFGSTVTGFASDEPDLDLLVAGIPRERFAEALGRLFLLAPLPIDLVPAEWGRPEIVARAREEGVVLHVTR